MPSPPLSQAERDALQREDARYLLMPLTIGGSPRSMAAHLRRAVRLLRDDDDPSPSASVVSRLNALYDLTTPHHPAIVCAKGCSYCCSQNVTVTIPEVFAVAAAIRDRPDLVAAVLAADEALRGLTPEARFGHVTCPLLVEGACSVYADRPTACRAFVSVDLSRCVTAFVDHGPADIPMPVAHSQTLFVVRMMLMAAMRLTGLDDRTFELTPALAVALRDPGAEARWRAGEDVFAAIAANPPIPRAADLQIAQMVDHVAGTV